MRMGWAGEAEVEVLAGSEVVGGVEEQADELSPIIGSRKKGEKRGFKELWLFKMENVEEGTTDRKNVASAISLEPRNWKKTKNGGDVFVLPIEFEAGRADECGQNSSQDDRARTDQRVVGAVENKKVAFGDKKWRDKKNQPWRTEKGKDG
jgi:hypothetical protein